MQIVPQELGSRLLTPHLEDGFRNIIIRQTVQIIYPAAAIYIGNGFNIKH
jgi:hypothetical protein